MIILRNILYLLYLCKCLGLCDLLFIFSLIFIAINHITSSKEMLLSFVYFLEYLLLFLDDNAREESE